MKIEYDTEADVLVIVLREGEYAESDEVAPNVIMDFDTQGEPLRIEILNARQVLGLQDRITLEIPVALRQPAA
jgi:uncharacterized protein YuzE